MPSFWLLSTFNLLFCSEKQPMLISIQSLSFYRVLLCICAFYDFTFFSRQFYCFFIVHVILICVYKWMPLSIPFFLKQKLYFQKKTIPFKIWSSLFYLLVQWSQTNFEKRMKWKDTEEQEQMHWCFRFIFESSTVMKNEHGVGCISVQLSKMKIIIVLCSKCVRIVYKHSVYIFHTKKIIITTFVLESL